MTGQLRRMTMRPWRFRQAIVAAALAFGAVSLRAQALLLTGHVTSVDGAPLRSARVTLDGTSISGLTDSEGAYAIILARGSAHPQHAMLTARLVGFKPVSKEVTLTGSTLGRDFSLPVNP